MGSHEFVKFNEPSLGVRPDKKNTCVKSSPTLPNFTGET